MGNPRAKADPAQDEIRVALNNKVNEYPCLKACAAHMGVCESTIRDFIGGRCRIPEWVCEWLGYRKVYVKVGTVGIRPA